MSSLNQYEILYELQKAKLPHSIWASKVLAEKGIGAGDLKQVLNRLQNDEPIEYIIGRTDFSNLKLVVNQHTLIPRIETELLVQIALFRFNEMALHNIDQYTHVIDIGTGSGAIILAIAKGLELTDMIDTSEVSPKADLNTVKAPTHFIGLDISADALKVARKNYTKNEIENEVSFIQSNLLDFFIKSEKKLKEFENAKVLILANLPYIPSSDYNKLGKSVLKFEPKTALDGGKDGLQFYDELGNQLLHFPDSTEIDLLYELDIKNIAKKAKQLEKKEYFFGVNIIKDQFERDRFLSAQFAKSKTVSI